ncbi:conjugal transfer protein [Leifsonia shinshuensis]
MRKKAQLEEAPEAEAVEAPRTESHTKVKHLSSKLAAGVFTAALLCGPVSLLLLGLGLDSSAPTVAVAGPKQAGLTSLQQQAGEYAVSFTGAWLSATQTDSTTLKSFLDTSNLRFPAQARVYRDLLPSAVEPARDSDLVTVTVAASVQEAQSNGSSVWVPRYFQVVVQAAKAGLAPVGLPAPVAAPAAAQEKAPLNYGTTLPTSSAAGQTVQAFLTAYLTGQGDISRVLTPGTEISAIQPAPYTAVTVASLGATTDAPDKPADGALVRVIAQARLAAAADQEVPATYTFTLKARAGRWEILRLDSTPALQSPTE